MTARRLALALALTALATSALAGKKARRFELAYTPTDVSEGILDTTGLADVVLAVDEVADLRQDKDAIGRNAEAKKAQEITTPTEVGPFVRSVLARHLGELGLTVGEEPTHRVAAEILTFSVVLDGTYKATVRLRLRVTDRSGAETFAVATAGDATRFSMSESPANYLEALSDALLEAMDRAFLTPEFATALSG